MCKSIALKLSARCVPPRGAAQHQPRGCAAHSSSVRTTRLIIRLLLRFELPGWYFGTVSLIIRLVVQLIIRLVVNYQLQADNPADNQAVSFVVYLWKMGVFYKLQLAAPKSYFLLPAFVARILNPRSRKSGYGLLVGSRSALDRRPNKHFFWRCRT